MKISRYKMTVLMPSYNNGQYIRQALDSILQQEVNFNYQIIVTDDCSTDDSPQIIKEYEETYPDRILALYSNKNCRLFRNILKALEKMDSEYFCVLDPDDYWSDKKRLQKAVDFLDNNQDYTIYATNCYKIYNDGSVEEYYNYPNIDRITSTYEDWLKGRGIISNTLASTYRNIYFSDGIPEEFQALIGTPSEEFFRADTGRNLIHLRRGKAYYVNEYIGYSRRHGRGLSSGMTEYEHRISGAFGFIKFCEFFGNVNESDYARMVKHWYTIGVREYISSLVSGSIPELSEQCWEHFKETRKWLQAYELKAFKKIFELKYKKVIIWGAGPGTCNLLNRYHISIHQDTFFVDNDKQKQGTEFMGRVVKAPQAILEEKDALVVIASAHYEEIMKQIEEEKLCTVDKVIYFYDYYI